MGATHDDHRCKAFKESGTNYVAGVKKLKKNANHSSPVLFARDFIKAYSHRPTFLHIHLSEFTHDGSVNPGRNYDPQLVEMLEEVSAADALKDTFFVFMGDHGFRFAPFSKTKQGNTENNMPALVVIPPKSLDEAMVANLQKNTRVLTSHYDMHHTLRHLLALSLERDVEEVFEGWHPTPGTSLLTPLPDRTCAEAGVPLEYCSCEGGSTPLPPHTLHGLVEAAMVDVDTFLEPLLGCRKLEGQVANVTRTRMKTAKDLVMVEAEVQMAIRPVEFSIKVNFLRNITKVSAILIRLDRYSETSKCVSKSETVARPLCICK